MAFCGAGHLARLCDEVEQAVAVAAYVDARDIAATEGAVDLQCQVAHGDWLRLTAVDLRIAEDSDGTVAVDMALRFLPA